MGLYSTPLAQVNVNELMYISIRGIYNVMTKSISLEGRIKNILDLENREHALSGVSTFKLGHGGCCLER